MSGALTDREENQNANLRQWGLEWAADHIDAQAARLAALEAERDEARRRRDEWRKKAEGYDEVRRALREKVGTPWPPDMSRLMWAGIAADQNTRADAAEAERDKLREALRHIQDLGAVWSDSFERQLLEAKRLARAALTETEGRGDE